MTARELLRSVVVATNPVWPFSGLNKIPYRLALAAAAKAFRSLDRFAGLYLRNSMAREEWVPGLSDVDLTLVLEDVAGAGRAYTRLGRAWRVYGRLKRLFPMLGELDVLTPETLDAWTRLATPGLEARLWRPLPGSPPLRSLYAGSSGRQRCDALFHALDLYLNVLLRRPLDGRSRVAASEALRLAAKIRRYARLAGGTPAGNGYPEGTPPRTAAAAAFLELEAAARSLDPGRAGTGRQGDAGFATEVGPEIQLAAAEERVSLAGRVLGIASVVRADRIQVVVLEEDVGVEEVASNLETVGTGPWRESERCWTVTPAVLRQLVRFVDPDLHANLAERGRVVSGSALRLPPPPGEEAFAYAVLAQVPNVLATAGYRDLVPPSDVGFVSGGGLAREVDRALAALTPLDRGSVPPSRAGIVALGRARHSEVAARLTAILEHPESDPGFEAFVLLRELAFELARRLGDGPSAGGAVQLRSPIALEEGHR